MLPEGFIDRLSSFAGNEAARSFAEAVSVPPEVSVRLNPFKNPSAPDPIFDGARGVPWSPYGRVLSSRPVFTLQPFFHSGAYYVQDSSAMYAGYVFRKILDRVGDISGIRVLDLCAAPGGKTTDLAASLRLRFGDDFLLVANDPVRKRAKILSENVALWGDPCVTVTCADPSAFSALEGFFDIIVTDVPCSGEGMFGKDPFAVEQWSEALVEECSSRQRNILKDVWPALREGGYLVYATCTFEPSENDLNFKWILSSLGAELCPEGRPDFPEIQPTDCGSLLLPGFVRGSGQWVSAAVKTSPQRSRPPKKKLEEILPVLRSGIPAPTIKGKDIIPDPDLPLSLGYERGTYPEFEVDESTALHFLHRDSVILPEDAPIGYVVLTYSGLPLGFVKNLGRRTNNLHPMDRRILMDIKA